MSARQSTSLLPEWTYTDAEFLHIMDVAKTYALYCINPDGENESLFQGLILSVQNGLGQLPVYSVDQNTIRLFVSEFVSWP